MAMSQLAPGPASATMSSPLRRSRRLATLTGVGFAQPMMIPPSVTETSVISAPSGSKWATGLREMRPNSFAVASPCW